MMWMRRVMWSVAWQVKAYRSTIEKPFFLRRVFLLILKFLPLENYSTLQQTAGSVLVAGLLGHIKIQR
jgi:hypothetical protein